MQWFALAELVFELELWIESISFIFVAEVFESQNQSLDKRHLMLLNWLQTSTD
jgi:hypothetical protein